MARGSDLGTSPMILGGWIPVRGAAPGTGSLLHAGLPVRQASEEKTTALNGVTVGGPLTAQTGRRGAAQGVSL